MDKIAPISKSIKTETAIIAPQVVNQPVQKQNIQINKDVKVIPAPIKAEPKIALVSPAPVAPHAADELDPSIPPVTFALTPAMIGSAPAGQPVAPAMPAAKAVAQIDKPKPAPVIAPKSVAPAPIAKIAAPEPVKAPSPAMVEKKPVQPAVSKVAPAAIAAAVPAAIIWDKSAAKTIPPVTAQPAPAIAAKMASAPAAVKQVDLPPAKAAAPSIKWEAAAPAVASKPVAVVPDTALAKPAPIARAAVAAPAARQVASPVLAAPVAQAATTQVNEVAAKTDPIIAAPKEKLGSINALDAARPDPVFSPSVVDSGNKELETSLLRKIQMLEGEKENLRKKLNALDPGGVGPVYQCAAESNKIHILEGQVEFLSQENQSLKKKNQELGTIPKLPEGNLDNLPDVKPEPESKQTPNANAGS